MHSRDVTVLIDLLWFNVMHYSSLFQYFFQATMVPTLANFLVYLLIIANSKIFVAVRSANGCVSDVLMSKFCN